MKNEFKMTSDLMIIVIDPIVVEVAGWSLLAAAVGCIIYFAIREFKKY